MKMMKIILMILQELLIFYQNDTVGENSPVPYENNKKVGLTMISSANKLSSVTQSEKILFKVLVTI